ncbi:sodium:alanine symporter family protein [Meiothermus sp. PNK-Is4]|uniref:alanine/glycine:cation symporter family protein n=1 Tax=Meiothermus sp. PNK-Is4 TaxID=2740565 RepID=UPI00102194CC|nr:amino acid carrier protein [Meiothermus sp. PNK-Is4]RYM33221.1 sodium:alanine symporter family protein [Meiothermus sp. PNK-Is4]
MDVLAINAALNRVVFGLEAKFVFLAVGLILTVALGFIQFRRLGVIVSETLGAIRERAQGFGGQITPFQAAMVAISATVGTGHFIGMIAAILTGGPGAVFWMWLGYLLGMATKFAEATLAVHFRRAYTDGSVSGGPMFYISRGLGRRLGRFGNVLGGAFALFAAVAAFGIGNLSQAGAVGNALQAAFEVPPAITGLVVAVIVGVIIGGGIRRIAAFTQFIVPVKLLLLALAILPLLILYAAQIPTALAQIFASAFNLQAFAGGAVGSYIAVINAGLGRGIFANEAGLGSAPIAHAQAQVDHPVRQGFWGVAEMLVSLTVTTLMALTFLASGLWQREGVGAAPQAAVTMFQAYPLSIGQIVLALTLAALAFGTMVSWAFYGEEAASYLFGEGIRWPYRLAFTVMAFVAPIGGFKAFIDISDTLNGFMAIPNLLALLLLAPLVAQLVREFFQGEPWRIPED